MIPNRSTYEDVFGISAEDKAEAREAVKHILRSMGASEGQAEKDAQHLTDFSGILAAVTKLREAHKSMAKAYVKAWKTCIVPSMERTMYELSAQQKTPPETKIEVVGNFFADPSVLHAWQAFKEKPSLIAANLLTNAQIEIEKKLYEASKSPLPEHSHSLTRLDYWTAHGSDNLFFAFPYTRFADHVWAYGFEKAHANFKDLGVPFPSAPEARALRDINEYDCTGFMEMQWQTRLQEHIESNPDAKATWDDLKASCDAFHEAAYALRDAYPISAIADVVRNYPNVEPNLARDRAEDAILAAVRPLYHDAVLPLLEHYSPIDKNKITPATQSNVPNGIHFRVKGDVVAILGGSGKNHFDSGVQARSDCLGYISVDDIHDLLKETKLLEQLSSWYLPDTEEVIEDWYRRNIIPWKNLAEVKDALEHPSGKNASKIKDVEAIGVLSDLKMFCLPLEERARQQLNEMRLSIPPRSDVQKRYSSYVTAKLAEQVSGFPGFLREAMAVIGTDVFVGKISDATQDRLGRRLLATATPNGIHMPGHAALEDTSALFEEAVHHVDMRTKCPDVIIPHTSDPRGVSQLDHQQIKNSFSSQLPWRQAVDIDISHANPHTQRLAALYLKMGEKNNSLFHPMALHYRDGSVPRPLFPIYQESLTDMGHLYTILSNHQRKEGNLVRIGFAADETPDSIMQASFPNMWPLYHGAASGKNLVVDSKGRIQEVDADYTGASKPVDSFPEAVARTYQIPVQPMGEYHRPDFMLPNDEAIGAKELRDAAEKIKDICNQLKVEIPNNFISTTDLCINDVATAPKQATR